MMNAGTFYFLDMRELKTEKVEIMPILDENAQSVLQRCYDGIGLEVHISRIADAEKLMSKYFETKGYEVIRLEYRANSSGQFSDKEQILANVCKFLFHNYKFYNLEPQESLNHYLLKAGVPDFLVFKEEADSIRDLMFIEVKSGSDRVSIQQLLWVTAHNVPVKIVYITNEEYEESQAKPILPTFFREDKQ
jgi:hypothetical protein